MIQQGERALGLSWRVEQESAMERKNEIDAVLERAREQFDEIKADL